jgi:uncharacterized protein
MFFWGLQGFFSIFEKNKCMIKRELQEILEGKLFKGKAIIILGPRQVGKTTLMNQLVEKTGIPTLQLNCDEPEVRAILTNSNASQLERIIGSHKLVTIDEAQRVENIGLTLKILTDSFKDIQLLVSGSSSLDLANKINEPLTGRKLEYTLFPFSAGELVSEQGYLATIQQLESRLIFGSYPDIVMQKQDAKELLINLTQSYLYKDILSITEIRKPALLDKILTALALQLGSEVSYNELAQIIQSDVKTVEKYIDLLEKCFVIFRLNALSRNMRNELKKAKKIYFYDNGIRNALIQNFSPLALRTDTGVLWENYFVTERMKRNQNKLHYCRSYFWRTLQQQEVDLIEEADGQFIAYEMKWNETKKTRFPKAFLNSYSIKESIVITPANYLDYL